MGLQDTASKTELLLHCTRPYAEETEIEREEPGEAAIYGSAFHEAIAQHLKAYLGFATITVDVGAAAAKWGVDAAALEKHVRSALRHLENFLGGNNRWGETFRVEIIEKPLATRLRVLRNQRLSIETRECDFEESTHTYDLAPGEFGGTPDIVAIGNKGHRLVLDHKSGTWGDYSMPEKLPQLLTLALMTGANMVAVLHAPRDFPATIYAEVVSNDQLAAHAKLRRRAMRRVGDGSLTPGSWCCRCPAKSGCPAKDNDLLKKATALVKTVSGSLVERHEHDLGKLHLMMADVDKVMRRAREEMRDLVMGGEVIERPDGKVLQMVPKTYERLSKSSVIAALGKVAGERMLEKLRKLGCFTEDTREEMWAK